MRRKASNLSIVALIVLLSNLSVSAFLQESFRRACSQRRRTQTVVNQQAERSGALFSVTSSSEQTTERVPRGFGKTNTAKEKVPNELTRQTVPQIKNELLDLLAHMTGQEHEFRRVEQLVNVLEERYMPAQTLDFLNLALQGSWQLLFSTNLSGTPNPQKFRLVELVQTIDTNQLAGQIRNTATWDLAEAGDGQFQCRGTFAVTCRYEINQGARCVVTELLDHHVLRPAPPSTIPNDVPALVGLLHRSMPKSLFDPRDHAMDTTYCDADLRIVRYTGPRLEGVRDIFQRRGVFLDNNDDDNDDNGNNKSGVSSSDGDKIRQEK